MSVTRMIVLVFLSALAFALWREPTGRVFVILFAAGLVECWVGVFALMALFESLHAFAEAPDTPTRLVAFAETTLILVLSGTLMAILAVLAGAMAWRFAM